MVGLSVITTMVTAALSNKRIFYAALVGVGALVFVGSIYFVGRDHGADSVREQIQEQDNRVQRDVGVGTRAVNECHDGGGVWDVTTGTCF